jgi:hypothetical protein
MIISPDLLNDQLFDVCIVGAGPAGITASLELEDSGLKILLVDSGTSNSNSQVQSNSDAIIKNTLNHAPMHEAIRAQLGGTSSIWGGRCVPLDSTDFQVRDYMKNSGWPISFDEINKYYPSACTYSLCGKPNFSSLLNATKLNGGLTPSMKDGNVLSSSLERWSLPVNFWINYQSRLKDSSSISVLTGFSCTKINFKKIKNHVSSIYVKNLQGSRKKICAKYYIVACGGLETTRLLLDSDKLHKKGVGNKSGLLGKFYMGHISGKIASIQFTKDIDRVSYNFEKDYDGVYCKKRLTISESEQNKSQLLNFSAWIDHPLMGNHRHGSGFLSLAYLALCTPFFGRLLAPDAIIRYAKESNPDNSYTKHVKNIFLDFHRLIFIIPVFMWKKFAKKRKLPGLQIFSRSGSYPLHYHAEHSPNKKSKVSLSNEKDDLGRRRLLIDFNYSDTDVDSVIKNHQIIDDYLRSNKLGYLKYDMKDLNKRVFFQARDGFHQIGTTRMSKEAHDGVVDLNCRVHGVENLYVSSSSVFPTSGQANPTLTIVALSIRVAHTMKRLFKLKT